MEKLTKNTLNKVSEIILNRRNQENFSTGKIDNFNLDIKLQDCGIGLEESISLFENQILPFISNTSTNSKYFSYVIGGSTPAALIGDILTSALDQNLALYDRSSASPLVEQLTIKLLLEMFDLQDFYGIFTT